MVGRVDEDGKLSGNSVAYLYPDFRSAFLGTFRDGVMRFARAATLTGITSEGSIKVPVLSEPTGRLYSREVSTYDFVTDSPTLPDPYESVMVEARKSNVPGADDGLFAR